MVALAPGQALSLVKKPETHNKSLTTTTGASLPN
jgi:hypothetical protein